METLPQNLPQSFVLLFKINGKIKKMNYFFIEGYFQKSFTVLIFSLYRVNARTIKLLFVSFFVRKVKKELT
jgi:hypothetical protein